jgi:hypothetical protein
LRGAAAGGPPEVAFVAGELAAIERKAALEARRDWPSAWKAVRKAVRTAAP